MFFLINIFHPYFSFKGIYYGQIYHKTWIGIKICIFENWKISFFTKIWAFSANIYVLRYFLVTYTFCIRLQSLYDFFFQIIKKWWQKYFFVDQSKVIIFHQIQPKHGVTWQSFICCQPETFNIYTVIFPREKMLSGPTLCECPQCLILEGRY